MSAGLGQKTPCSPNIDKGSFGIKRTVGAVERKTLLPLFSRQSYSLRQLRFCLGRSGLPGKFSQRFLEVPGVMAHQHKGVGSQCPGSQIIGQTGRSHQVGCGQHRLPVLSIQVRGQTSPSERSDQGSVSLVPVKKYYPLDRKGEECRLLGRLSKQVAGSQRLLPSQRTFPLFKKVFPALGKSHSGRFCFPKQHPTPPVHFQVSALEQFSGGCSPLQSKHGSSLLQQPPLAPHRFMASKTFGKSSHCLPHGGTPLGFITLDAPFQAASGARGSTNKDPPFQGMFSDFKGKSMPPPRWDLLCCVLSGAAWNTKKFRLRPSTIFF